MKEPAKEQLKREIITLLSKDGVPRASAAVMPGLGANLVSFHADGVEFIYWNERGFLSDGTFSGAFNMFPTPCRLAECQYSFEGREIKQKKNGKEVFLHGLLRDEPMESGNNGDSITSWLEVTPAHPVFEGFPFEFRLTVTHALEMIGERGDVPSLKVGFVLENKDSVNIPFGFGVHPYWRIYGSRGDVRLRIPCDGVLEQENLVPTGGCSPVSGTGFDLRAPRSLEGLDLDNIFYERREQGTADIEFGALRKKIVISASRDFTHMIAYTPPGKPYFCVENLTTSPNAPNLVSAGKGDCAHMLVVPPGGRAGGWVRYSVETI
jgi:aldose 1-epimerase